MEPLPQRVLILGMGRSGEAVARHVASRRAAGDQVEAALLDEDSGEELQRRARQLTESTGVPVTLDADRIDGSWDLVVASPGIPPRSPLMRSARALGVPVISEIELAWRSTDARWIAITGTNGKTTTTALTAHLLRESGMDARAVGNIGEPAISAAADAGRDTVLVAEVSSFQLALTERFRPRVAVLLNITPDHVDWHGSLEAYEADKARVFANLGPDDVAVIDVDDPGSAPWADRVSARGAEVVRVATGTCAEAPAGAGACVRGGALVVRRSGEDVRLVDVDELAIRGRHNVGNALAAAAAALVIGAAPSAVRDGLRTFRPIAHRLEPVGVVAGVHYYNDSKATNPDAVLKALTAFDERPLIVLLGGRNKGNDFTELAGAVAGRCRLAVLFGESTPELRDAFARAGAGCPTLEAAGLRDAVAAAAGVASPGEVVVLSPACASFDEFRSYEHRGDVFRETVASMAAAEAEG